MALLETPLHSVKINSIEVILLIPCNCSKVLRINHSAYSQLTYPENEKLPPQWGCPSPTSCNLRALGLVPFRCTWRYDVKCRGAERKCVEEPTIVTVG